MSDSNNNGGFSFQLSETPPPTETKDLTPLGDLNLDLGAFGEPQEEPILDFAAGVSQSPPPAEVQAHNDAPAPFTSEPESPEAVRELEPVPPAKTAELTVPRETESTRTETASEDPQVATRATDTGPAVKPRIKKIQFPATRAQSHRAKAKPSEPTLAPAEASEPSRPITKKPQTRFSESISAPAVTARLIDSEPPPSAEEFDDGLSLPDDLPSQVAPKVEPASWGTETPSAKEIWKSARKAWSTTAKQAVVLSGQGLRASRNLAGEVNDRMKQRLEASARERDAKAALKAETDEHLKDEGMLPEASVEGAPKKTPVATGVLVQLGKSGLRKMAAPLSAVAAATAVYMGGTQLLGVDGGVALSKAAQGPDIPELGALEEPAASGDDSVKKKKSEPGTEKAEESDEKPKTGPPAMQTEVTKMPDGLSWPGKGLIEVVTSEEELIYVDGVFTGRGPLRRIPVSPGEHEVSIRSGGKKRGGSVHVKVNKNTRAVFKGE